MFENENLLIEKTIAIQARSIRIACIGKTVVLYFTNISMNCSFVNGMVF
jgi:hypothetical protein